MLLKLKKKEIKIVVVVIFSPSEIHIFGLSSSGLQAQHASAAPFCFLQCQSEL